MTSRERTWTARSSGYTEGFPDAAAAAAAKLLQSCPTLCGPIDSLLPGSSVLGFSRQEHWRGLPFPSPRHESESESEVAQSCLTLSDPVDCSLPTTEALFTKHGVSCGARGPDRAILANFLFPSNFPLRLGSVIFHAFFTDTFFSNLSLQCF